MVNITLIGLMMGYIATALVVEIRVNAGMQRSFFNLCTTLLESFM